MKNRRRLILVPLAAAAVTLAFASVAYACTVIVGSITTTAPAPNPNPCPNTGPTSSLCKVSTGDTITSTGSGLNVRTDPTDKGDGAPNGTRWGLYFLRYESNKDGMNTCMGNTLADEQKVGTQSASQASNSVTISGPIPGPRPLEPSGTGNARVCLVSEYPVVGLPNYRWATPSTDLVLL